MTRLALIAALVLLLVAGCGSGNKQAAQPRQATQPTEARSRSTTAPPSNPQRLTDLRDIDQLRSLFNTRSGEPRLILLVSPT
jgi:uncharacterized lipoprotein